ncbi:TIGR03621 family F420-dependent LLM class oxidoreductase [Amycolatopsis pigmentata]|uniref:TIGR03621 family F420-dependent LLM class oxidoreductase n=1 Tax=Amycolatopsis pigmentata TaxID=450801 RepID=A0ABW5FKZ8_9PSEU
MSSTELAPSSSSPISDRPRPFRFGVMAGAKDTAGWTELVQGAERLGYSTVFLSDHLDLSGSHVSTMSPLPATAATAMLTERLHVGTAVLNQDLRHPVVVAQEAATIQQLSGGRLELGIGAGWAKTEYDWAGIPFDDSATRVRRLAEYAQVVRAVLHSSTSVDFDGEFFHLDKMPGSASATVPPPPLMLGGKGSSVLGIAARFADIVNLNMVGSHDACYEDVDAKLNDLGARHARTRELELAMMVGSVIVSSGDRRSAAQQRIESLATLHSTGLRDPDQALLSPSVLVGSEAQIADDLLARRSRWGISYFIVRHEDMTALAPVIDQIAGV